MELSDRIRPKSHGIGRGRFWEYKDNRNMWTVAPSKEEAIKRALSTMEKDDVACDDLPDRFFDPADEPKTCGM